MTIIYALAGLACLVCIVAYVRRGPLLPACAAFLVVNAALGHLFWTARVGPWPLALDRLMLVALVGMFFLHRRWGWTQPKQLAAIDWLLVATIAWFALRTFTSEFTHQDPGGVAPWWHLTVGYLCPAALYVVARNAPANQRTVTFVHATLTVFGVYLAVMAILEIAGAWSLVFPRHIADPQAGLHFGRARGPTGNAIACGMYLCVAMAAAWLWRERLGRVGQLAVFAVMPLLVVGAFFTYTRCVWMAAAVVVMILLAATLPRRLHLVAISVLVLAVSLTAAARWDQIVNFDSGRPAEQTRDSTYMRASFAYISWQMFLDRPLAGCGLGQYTRAKNPYLADRSTSLVLESVRHEINHNLLLSILVETGAVGLALFVALLVGWGRNAWRLATRRTAPPWARRQGVLMLCSLGTYLPLAVFQPTAHINIVQMLLMFLAGLTAGMHGLAAAPNPHAQRAPIRTDPRGFLFPSTAPG